MSRLVAKKLKVTRKKFELDVPEFALERGEIVALLGPSGSGKTTLMTALGGLEKQTSGTILFDGQELTPQMARVNMAGVFQFPYLMKGTVEKNAEYGLRIRKTPAEERHKRVSEALSLVGLSGYEKRTVHELSGGEQQRVALARALVLNPQVLMLDEPLSSLDENLKRHLSTEFRRILKERCISALYVTHDRTEALTVADRLVILNEGKIVADAPVRDYFARIKNDWARGFLQISRPLVGSIVERNAEGSGYVVSVGGQIVTLASSLDQQEEEKSGVQDILERGRKVELFLSPRDIVVTAPCKTPNSDDWLSIKGRITQMTRLGEKERLTIETIAGTVDAIALRIHLERLKVQEGDEISIVIATDAVQWAASPE